MHGSLPGILLTMLMSTLHELAAHKDLAFMSASLQHIEGCCTALQSSFQCTQAGARPAQQTVWHAAQSRQANQTQC